MSVNEIPQRCVPCRGEKIHDYIVEQKLGEGTFGAVYKVLSPSTNHIYALKILKLWTVSNDDDRENLRARFRMEYETGQIESRNLVHSIAYGNMQGNPYIIMEYCTGGDLTNYIGTMNHKQIAEVSSDILTGLSDLHASAKVHRDLKPENVLLNQDGVALLTDFGVSGDSNRRLTETDWMNRAKSIFGTYAYISPEQFNRKYDATVLPTTDIFSFGAMFYEIITGELPFGHLQTDSDLSNYIKNMKSGNWHRPTLNQYKPKAEWIEIIEKSLKPNYKDRFQTASEIIPLLGVAERGAPKPHPRKAPLKAGGIVLRVMQGENYGMVYNLSNLIKNACGLITLGRHDYGVSNLIPIIETKSCYVSRHHATIEQCGNESWIIRDGQWRGKDKGWVDSTNGTFVNSTEVARQGLELHLNDIISVGDVKLRLELL